MKPHRYRCWSCKTTFPSFAAAVRHVDGLRRTVQDDHGGRIEIMDGGAK